MKQTIEELKSLGFASVDDALPAPNELVIAVTPSFRCLARRDQNGLWRTELNNEEISNVIAWASVQAGKERMPNEPPPPSPRPYPR